MSLTEEDILEIFQLLEEHKQKKLLEKQFLDLSLNQRQELDQDSIFEQEQQQLNDPSELKEKVQRQEAMETKTNQEIHGSDQEQKMEQSVVRLKREKLRENLRKNQQEQIFKEKRILSQIQDMREKEDDVEQNEDDFSDVKDKEPIEEVEEKRLKEIERQKKKRQKSRGRR